MWRHNSDQSLGVTRQMAGKITQCGTTIHLCILDFTSLLDTVFFRTDLPCSGGYHMERGGMPLHDAVGINCNKGAITEHQDSAVKYMG